MQAESDNSSCRITARSESLIEQEEIDTEELCMELIPMPETASILGYSLSFMYEICKRCENKRNAVFDRCHSSGKRNRHRAVSDGAVLKASRDNQLSIQYLICKQTHLRG